MASHSKDYIEAFLENPEEKLLGVGALLKAKTRKQLIRK